MVQVPNTFQSGTIAESAKVNENFATVTDAINPTFVFTITGSLTTGTSLTPTLIVHSSVTIEKVYAYAKTAPTGADILIDININGTSIWNVTQANRLTIPAGASDQAYNQTSFDTTSLSEGDRLTIDLDQVGSTVSGQDLTVELRTS